MKKKINLLILLTTLMSVVCLGAGRIQNEDVKSLSDIESSVLSTTGNLSNGSACITSPGSTTGLATGLYVYDTTNPTYIPSGTTIAGLPGTCSSGQIQMSANATHAATGDTITFGGQASQLINDTKIWLTGITPNVQLSSALSKGLIGGSGGSKNYLSTYVSSTNSGNANTGNGNFEQGSTTGWSLAHSSLSSGFPTSVASAGSAFSSSSGGSSANGNLSLTVVSSGQISGNYSGDLASSSSSTAGDMLISNAFNIDTSDQAKMMTIQFHYSVNSGASNLNFSGTSSNSYAIFIYDVTNAAWIMPAGVYGMVQNFGVGYATNVTFQTTSNSTQYQLALVNVNASSGAFALYLDDFILGPQTAPSGPVMSDWQTYSLSITGSSSNPTLGSSPTYNNAYWRRVGDSMEIFYNLVQANAGSAGSGDYYFNIPSGYAIDTTKIIDTAESSVGSCSAGDGSHNYVGDVEVQNSTGFRLRIAGLSGNAFGTIVGSSSIPLSNSQAAYSFSAKVPIVGWSSNTQMSSDTDTRVVSAKYFSDTNTQSISSGSATTLTTIWDTQSFDTHAAFNTSNGTYTAPVSGFYNLTVYLRYAANSTGIRTILYSINGGTGKEFAKVTAVVEGGTSTGIVGSTQIQLNAGQTVAIQAFQDSGSSLSVGGDSNAYFLITRVSGPAVVAATELVAMDAEVSSTSLTANTTNAVFSSVKFDTHNAYNSSTGVYTIPVAGYYSVFASIEDNANNSAQVALFQNGSIIAQGAPSSTTSNASQLSHLFKANAGDTISIRSSATTTLNGAVGSALNKFEIQRLKN